ncbi:Memo-like protein [Sedimentisphaera cyanobacteriorum]|uniref:Memo-like protein n=1 Tax=Sedimentisphaera cyanobacteriorum TaxID=1940790 RepID=A0A1Q2HNJ8_9BACT|nr:AmmeMemoRadiSam system protein B [Sedimentisphaera cyanobacteriorum]AQQ08825.1 Memo-like protein [Sedimentisphaera cyanobacteriorum]
MVAREMICAGSFYPSLKSDCQRAIDSLLQQVKEPQLDTNFEPKAAVVPHAGWEFCGDVTASVFNALKESEIHIDIFLLFGAVHLRGVLSAAVYNGSAWKTPMGIINANRQLADSLVKSSSVFEEDSRCHSGEHSLEVVCPFIKHLYPDAEICPVLVPPSEDAFQAGQQAAEAVKDLKDKNVFCIASSDLTHYGRRFDFAPAGEGETGCKWAKDVNDKAFIEAAVSMNAKSVLSKGIYERSSCGPGAVAAAVEYARQMGSKKGRLLKHTHSFEVISSNYLCSSDSSVGYAGIIF